MSQTMNLKSASSHPQSNGDNRDRSWNASYSLIQPSWQIRAEHLEYLIRHSPLGSGIRNWQPKESGSHSHSQQMQQCKQCPTLNVAVMAMESRVQNSLCWSYSVDSRVNRNNGYIHWHCFGCCSGFTSSDSPAFLETMGWVCCFSVYTTQTHLLLLGGKNSNWYIHLTQVLP